MTREQIEQAIDRNLDSLFCDENGTTRRADDGQPATSEDIDAALRKHDKLEALLRGTP